MPERPKTMEIRGGAWLETISCTWPFGKLTASTDWVKISCERFGGETVFTRGNLLEIRRRRSPLGRGLKFIDMAEAKQPTTFWPVSCKSAVAQLETLGWSVTL
jgi:hypothetical protein